MPRGGHLNPRAAQSTDRNPIAKNQANKQSAIAPAAETVRWTYTVPTAKRAQVMAGCSSVVRVTAAAPAGYAYAALRHNDGTTTAYYCLAAEIGNAVDSDARAQIGNGPTALAGHVLDAVTADASTGGTVTFENHASIVEYDA